MSDAVPQEFDSEWYLRRHCDVAGALKRGEIASALDHYRNHGQAEGREIVPASPEFILHVGPHKTGSSHLQALIGANEKVLAQQGVSLPGLWARSPNDHNHTRLIDALLLHESDTIRTQIDELVQLNPGRVVVSAEDLCLLSSHTIALLGQALCRHRVTVVYYLRNWAARIYSVWQEEVRHGYCASFKSYLADHLIAPGRSEIINPTICLDRFAGVFGASNLQIVSYDETVEQGRDLYEHFAYQFLQTGVSDNSFTGSKTHPSPQPVITETARLMNIIGATSGLQQLGMTYLDHRRSLDNEALAKCFEEYWTEVELDTAAEPLPVLSFDFYKRYAHRLIEPRPKNICGQRVIRVRALETSCLSDARVRLHARRLARETRKHRTQSAA